MPKKLIRHILALGFVAGIFAILFASTKQPGIRISLAEQQGVLKVAALGEEGIQLSPEKADAVRGRLAEDAVLYQEGLSLGLDKNDPIVKQRVIQKVLALAEDLSEASVPTEEDLLRYFKTHASQWTQGKLFHFTHIFVTKAHKALLPELTREAESRYPVALSSEPKLGDSFPLSRFVKQADLNKIKSDFGEEFAHAVETLVPLKWSRPLPSKFGWHLVKILSKQEGGTASYESVKNDVRFAYLFERRDRAIKAYIEGLKEKYHLTIESQNENPLISQEQSRTLSTETKIDED